MLTRIKTRDDRDAGFTLIELLVVVVIIGILAAIAIPVFLNQRNAARNASVESDLRNLATVMETYYTTHDGYPTDAQGLIDEGGKLSAGNAANVQVYTDGAYTIQGCNLEAGDLYMYSSAGGGFVAATATTFTCPTDPTATPDPAVISLAAGVAPPA